MPLTGLDIYKQLPKTNCKECGHPTCLAFAMALASGKASLDACPHVSQEARAALDAAAAPPMAEIVIGTGAAAVKLGGETELFRHEKRFYNPTVVALLLSDSLPEAELNARVQELKDLAFHRVGLEYRVQMVAVKCDTGQAETFKKAVELAQQTGLALMLVTEDPQVMAAGLEVCAQSRPLLYAATEANLEAMLALAKANACVMAVKARGLEALAALAQKVSVTGFKDLVLDPDPTGLAQAVADLVQIRRLAIKKRFRPFGYPAMVFARAQDPAEEALEAATCFTKYASLVVLKNFSRPHLLPLLTWRQNLYTDPQVPIQVEEKLNEIGNPNENSPVYVTTNFSLTYYSVQGEVEGSRIPSYILSVNTNGLSVMTAYADGRFTAEKIAQVMKKFDLDSRIKHRSIVIPGAVAVLKGKLEELTGWKVLVGPREASGIPAFAKSTFSA
ncbi:MAG: acetyl-CoA decarbonylase/synthase complex subunit gamma [Moorellales bacterium]